MGISDLTSTQLAYIAGLIDGEGSVESQREHARNRTTPCFTLRLAFIFATEEPLRTICAWIGATPKCFPAVDERRQPRWRVSLKKGVAIPLLRACLPYIILKRHQIELALQIESVRAEHSPGRRHVGFTKMQPMPLHAVAQMEELHAQLRATKLNKRPVELRRLL